MLMALSMISLTSGQRQLVDVTHLIGVHEAGIAHHVAAVGQIHRQDGAAAVLYGAAAVVVQTFVVVGWNIPAGKVLLDPLEELHIDGHEVFGLAVLGAFLDHPDLAVSLNNVGFDLADLLVEQLLPLGVAAGDCFPGFPHAFRAQRIGLAWPAQRRFCLLPGLQQGLFRPLRSKRRGGVEPVEILDRVESDTGTIADCRVDVLHHPRCSAWP